jgi:hypothetical protein
MSMGEIGYYVWSQDWSEMQGYDNAGNPIGSPIPRDEVWSSGNMVNPTGEEGAATGGEQRYNGVKTFPQSRKEEVTQFYKNKVAGQEYGAPSLKAEDFLTPDGRPISANDAVAKWKELFPNTELDDAQILAKVKDEMPQFQDVKQEDRDFARQGFTRDMYSLQGDAMKQGAQMRGAYGGMGSSMRGAYAGGQNLQQQYSFAEQDYERDIYNLEQDAMSSYESDLANFATTAGFKEGGLVPNKKEETFLDVLARIPDAKGS